MLSDRLFFSTSNSTQAAGNYQYHVAFSQIEEGVNPAGMAQRWMQRADMEQLVCDHDPIRP